jgi:myo-inositol 2-dehydrogenase/D-chiro-inositol 1-dehydrogenase/scyllo-inositol 2-dehydrogenase (NAD+)
LTTPARPFVAEVRHLMNCIVHNHTPAGTGEDGRAAVLAVLAANRSIRTGKPVGLAQS